MDSGRQRWEGALLVRRVDEFLEVIKTVNPEQGKSSFLCSGQVVGIENSGQDGGGHQLVSAEIGNPGARLSDGFMVDALE